jgi:hypothetical protein
VNPMTISPINGTTSPGDGKMPQCLPETAGNQTPEGQALTEIIPPALDTALRTAGVDTRDPNVSRAIEISLMMYSGTLPLPPPPVLALTMTPSLDWWSRSLLGQTNSENIDLT